MNVEIRTEAAQFLVWKHINGIIFAVYYMYAKCTHLDQTKNLEILNNHLR
jgi:hypothetical protein